MDNDRIVRIDGGHGRRDGIGKESDLKVEVSIIIGFFFQAEDGIRGVRT